ncbi:EEF1A lysine methyltransferase 3 [Callorhinchus milii]|uniref:Protein-lysine methyltransferase METTL21B-like n=1 Tax=Callorhinchus milii TaxID=7868 RepID=V9LB52_CALMI|nr:EEF1A lysine methyltransferase 3 [Callorhinchus milii]XP_042194137.1 EEF1A lysine methyltransferase 3 [Callorhinchus milii]|eukprot:gi/632977205/ref/XP_007905219.1/ PREDICTED: protein-lysine methyltransferase METTL21B-like [Callorhinchus milii]
MGTTSSDQVPRRFKFGNHILDITENYSNDLYLPSIVWRCSEYLCEYIVEENINFTGKKVIELNSGTGIVGILATLMGGEVTMTDRTNALAQLKENIDTNCANRGTILTYTLGDDITNLPQNFDYILGAGVVFITDTFSLLVDALKYLSSTQTVILLSTEKWKEFGLLEFYDKTLPLDFHCATVKTSQDVNVYRALKKY